MESEDRKCYVKIKPIAKSKKRAVNEDDKDDGYETPPPASPEKKRTRSGKR